MRLLDFEKYLKESRNRCLQGLQYDGGIDKADIKIWERVEIFLRHLREHYKVNKENFLFQEFPDITPYLQGSIDVLWRRKHALILINFKEKDADLYGQSESFQLKVNANFRYSCDGINLLNLFIK